MTRRRGLMRSLLLSAALALGLAITPNVSAEALDVYTTPGLHTINGREWRTECEKYSSTVERCRTELKADTITYTNGRFAQKRTWVFNNLTYKPAPRAQWRGNILATPGDHTSGGRKWRTECDTEWTGRGACRSMIWTNSYIRTSTGAFGTKWQWVFNNIVRFSDGVPAPAEFCMPAKSAVAGLKFFATEETEETQPPIDEATPTVEADPTEEAAPSEAAEPAEEALPTEETVPADEAEPTQEAEPTEEADPGQEAGPTEAVEPTEGAAPTDVAPLETSPGVSPAMRNAPSSIDTGTQQSIAPAAAAVVIKSVQHPGLPGGSLYDRLGPIEVTGTVAGVTDGATVTVKFADSAGKTRSQVTAQLAGGSFTATIAGGFTGEARLTITAPNAGEATRTVTLNKATATLSGATRINPLGTSTISGKVTPGIGNVVVEAQVAANGAWVPAGAARTLADGTYALKYTHGQGTISTSQVRVCVTLPWGNTIPSAGSMTIERARIADPVITNTTADEVRLTFRTGCPVGPSGLSTIRINQQSMDGSVYRGEIIVRRARAAEVADIFKRTFEAGFPIFQMTNPNEFGADDIKMMAANNTSAFNCRKVVGNPYAMSPHSYGYAVDVNPWQNPYRDPTGKWHPSTAHVKRTPVVPGMLTTSSAPVVAFKAHGWSWFSGWDWHHFEKK